MVRSKFAIFIDSFFFSIIIFVLSFFWIYKFIKIRSLSFVLSLIIFSISFIFYILFTIKKTKKILKNGAEKQYYDNILKTLKFQGIKENSNYFTRLLNCSFLGQNIYKTKKCYFYINFQNTLSVFDFILANDFFMQTDKTLPLFFICEKENDDFKNLLLASPTKYKVFYYLDIVTLMKEKQIFPIENKNIESKKINFKIINAKLKNGILKLKFKECFFTGISLILISVFIPYSLYYLIFGSLFLILAFASLFFKANKNQPIKNESTDINDFLN